MAKRPSKCTAGRGVGRGKIQAKHCISKKPEKARQTVKIPKWTRAERGKGKTAKFWGKRGATKAKKEKIDQKATA